MRDVVQNHLLQVIALLAMDAPVGRDPEVDARRKAAPVSRDAAAGSGARRARAIPRLSRRGRRRARFAGRDVRCAEAAHRYVALGRRAVLHPRGQAPADHRHRSQGRSEDSAAGDLRPDRCRAIELLPLPAQPRSRDLDWRARQASGRRNAGRAGGTGRAPFARERRLAVRAAAGRRDPRRCFAVHARRQRRSGVARGRSDPSQSCTGRRIRARHVGPAGGREAHCRR